MSAWHAPHHAGLRQGQPVAHRCAQCGHVSLPPLPVCPLGHRGGTWITLENRARIVWRTTGADGDFALVQFAGADTLSLARLTLPDRATHGVLRPQDTVPPALILFAEPG